MLLMMIMIIICITLHITLYISYRWCLSNTVTVVIVIVNSSHLKRHLKLGAEYQFICLESEQEAVESVGLHFDAFDTAERHCYCFFVPGLYSVRLHLPPCVSFGVMR